MIPKFRAWDTKHNQWICGSNLHIDINGILYWWNFAEYCEFQGDQEIANIVLMQSTGLKDENGKEIFEGDIVRYETQDGPEDDYVFWLEECAAWGLMPIGNEINKGCFLFNVGNDAVEIVGNIHQNPELLERN